MSDVVGLIALAFALHTVIPFQLPPQAKIELEQTYLSKGSDDYFHSRPSRRINPAIVRRMFRRYHELQNDELHDNYAIDGCIIPGSVTVKDKQFDFRYQYLHVLWTNWTDGKSHLPGGAPSDDPSGGERAR